MSANVLVVDDSATVRQQVRTALTQAGLNVIEAVDGADGSCKIFAGGVGCVVCDVNMPNKNGIDMVEEVRRDPRFAGLPIVMLTTEAGRDLIARAKAAGASGWIVKPFKADLLVAAVKKLTATA